jgi:hypothetical protein
MILQRIEEIIFAGYKENVSGNVFELKEDNKKAKCRTAKIQRTSDVLVYKFDKTPKREGIEIIDKFPFLNEVSGLKSMADFILFYEKKGRLFVIICNLKSGNKGNSADQVESGKIFANFLVETAKRMFQGDFGQIKPEFIPVLHSSVPLYKGTSKPNKIPQNKIRNFISNDSQTDICDLDAICH